MSEITKFDGPQFIIEAAEQVAESMYGYCDGGSAGATEAMRYFRRHRDTTRGFQHCIHERCAPIISAAIKKASDECKETPESLKLIQWIREEIADDESAMASAREQGAWDRYHRIEGHKTGLLHVINHIKSEKTFTAVLELSNKNPVPGPSPADTSDAPSLTHD